MKAARAQEPAGAARAITAGVITTAAQGAITMRIRITATPIGKTGLSANTAAAADATNT